MVVVLLTLAGGALIGAIVIIVRLFAAPKRVQNLAQLYKANKFAAATKMAKQILAKEPRNSDAHYYLGLSYIDDGKPELGLMELKTVNSIGKFDGMIQETVFRKKIAELYKKYHQPEEALKEYLLLVKRDPENADYYFAIGELFETRNRGDKAVNYYKKTISLDSRHANAYGRLGSLLYRGKRHNEAKTILETAVQLQPDNTIASFYLGKLQKDSKDYQMALKSFELSSKDPELKTRSLVERGNCYINLGDADRAESELKRAIKLTNDQKQKEVIYGRYLLSYIYEKSRKIEEAIQQWEAIYAVAPDFRDVAEKLSNYQDLRTDDSLKDFLIAGQSEFVETCKLLISAMGLVSHDVSAVPGGVEAIASEDSQKWRNQRKQPRLIQFLRVTDAIDENTVREFHERLRSKNVTRGILISSTNFTRMAQSFAESRPIELVDKEKLQKLLQSIPK